MTERRDEALTGDVIDPGSGNVRAYSWEWSELPGTGGRSRLPWFGIFLVVLGGLLLLRTLFPALETAGSLFFLAIGVAFLVSWAINRGMGSLYLGSIITATNILNFGDLMILGMAFPNLFGVLLLSGKVRADLDAVAGRAVIRGRRQRDRIEGGALGDRRSRLRHGFGGRFRFRSGTG